MTTHPSKYPKLKTAERSQTYELQANSSKMKCQFMFTWEKKGINGHEIDKLVSFLILPEGEMQ